MHWPILILITITISRHQDHNVHPTADVTSPFFHILQHVLRTKTWHLKSQSAALRGPARRSTAPHHFFFHRIHVQIHPRFPNDSKATYRWVPRSTCVGLEMQVLVECQSFFLPFPNQYKSSNDQGDVDLSTLSCRRPSCAAFDIKVRNDNRREHFQCWF